MLNYDNDSYVGSVVSFKDYYMDKMVQYADEATKRFGNQFANFHLLQEYVDCIAVEFSFISTFMILKF